MQRHISGLGRYNQANQAPFNSERALRVRRPSDSPAPASVGRIDLRFLASSPWVSAPSYEAADITALDGTTLAWLRHGKRWWSTHRGRAGVELELLDDRARIQAWHGARFGTPRIDAERAPWMMLALHLAICEAMRARGFVPLHAAVLARDGRATALIGRGDAAKSTALASAVDSGWLQIAEDCAWLDVTTRKVFSWAGDDRMRRRIPAHWRHAAWSQCDDNLVLTDDDMSPWRPVAAELTRVVLVHRNMSRDSEMEALPAWESTRALWEIVGIPLCHSSRDALAARIPDLVSQLEWARLVLGRTPPVL
jgi:hypothetical protein